MQIGMILGSGPLKKAAPISKSAQFAFNELEDAKKTIAAASESFSRICLNQSAP
ncbi:hypothetical protein ACVWZV_000238 [Bradyrhizobium sp. GM5.1]